MEIYTTEIGGLQRIAISFEYEVEKVLQVKKLEGAKWSQSLKIWHIAPSDQNKQLIAQMFPEAKWREGNRLVPDPAIKIHSVVKAEVFSKKIILKMPKNDTDIIFIKGILYARWLTKDFVWQIPNYPGNLDKLKQYFGERIEVIIHKDIEENNHDKIHAIDKGSVLLILTAKSQIRIIFHFIPLVKNWVSIRL